MNGTLTDNTEWTQVNQHVPTSVDRGGGDIIIVLFEIQRECMALQGVFVCNFFFDCIILIH